MKISEQYTLSHMVFTLSAPRHACTMRYGLPEKIIIIIIITYSLISLRFNQTAATVFVNFVNILRFYVIKKHKPVQYKQGNININIYRLILNALCMFWSPHAS